MFLFLFAPIALPPIGAGKGLSGIAKAISLLVKHLDYFLSFVAVILVLILFYKVYKVWHKKMLQKINIILYKLYSEVLLADRVKGNAKVSSNEIDTIDLILEKIKKKFFIKKIGKQAQEEFVLGLELIKSENIDSDSSLILVSNWIKMLNYLILDL